MKLIKFSRNMSSSVAVAAIMLAATATTPALADSEPVADEGWVTVTSDTGLLEGIEQWFYNGAGIMAKKTGGDPGCVGCDGGSSGGHRTSHRK